MSSYTVSAPFNGQRLSCKTSRSLTEADRAHLLAILNDNKVFLGCVEKHQRQLGYIQPSANRYIEHRNALISFEKVSKMNTRSRKKIESNFFSVCEWQRLLRARWRSVRVRSATSPSARATPRPVRVKATSALPGPHRERSCRQSNTLALFGLDG